MKVDVDFEITFIRILKVILNSELITECNSNILNANWDNLYNCIALTLKEMSIDTDRNFLLGGNANHPDHLLR